MHIQTHIMNTTETALARKFRAQFPCLNETELRLYSMIAFGRTSNEIAKLCGCSVRTVLNYRYRIEKKLDQLPGGEKPANVPTRPRPVGGQTNMHGTHVDESSSASHRDNRWLVPGIWWLSDADDSICI